MSTDYELELEEVLLDFVDDEIVRHPHRRVAPLSFAQQRLWMASQVAPDAALYNVSSAMRLTAPPHFASLRAALTELVRRHEALRTAFDVDEESHEPVQLIAMPYEPQLAIAHARDEAEAMEMYRAEAGRPFDLRSGRLLRALLIRFDDQQILVLTTHHIVSDAWSLEILWRELGELLARHPLHELPVQYADFAAWDRERLDGSALAPALAYWSEQLAALPDPIALPFDRPRTATPTHAGASRTRVIDEALSHAVRSLAKRESATTFMTLLAAWQVLLHRITGANDLVVGSPISGRNREEVEHVIGFFVNTLPLRAIVSPTATFREFLRTVRATCIDAFAHQDVPFEKLVEVVAPPREPGVHPIFQAAFATHPATLPHPLGSNVPFPSTTSKFELLLEVEEGRELTARITYAADLFDAATIDRILASFVTLLTSIAANPDARIGRLAILDAAERALVLHGANDTQTDVPRGSLKALFELQARLSPHRVAVVDGDRSITYAELDARASEIAATLTPGTLVGIQVERSLEMIIGIVAIIKAGCAYVPLDPSYPEERLRFIIEDAGIEQGLGVRWPSHRSSMPEPGTEQSKAAAGPPHSYTYLIYTSGSTGTPKGVAVPQSAIVRLVFNTNYLPFSGQERIAQISNASFDAATFEIWGALLHGATLVILPRETMLSTRTFADALRRHEISALFITTALFNQHVREMPDVFATVRHVLFGGEACDPKAIAACLAGGPPARLVHVYGPTESTTFASWHLVEHVDATTVPIGKPLSNTTLYVLDAELQPVPFGVAGELFVGGDGLAHGYHRRPTLTAERFIPNPFVPDGARLYRTGDRVRMLANGAIEFLGRLDDQVKVRGFRIELGEIESVLRTVVSDACVIARDSCLIAYVVGDVQHAREVLRAKLPDYMVPSAFVALDALPLNANGKVDRRALPAPQFDAIEIDEPTTETECVIARIWSDVLGVAAIGIHQNFFDHGGHSLLATRVVSRVRKALGVELPLRTFFDGPTVAAMASACEALREVIRHPSSATAREEFEL